MKEDCVYLRWLLRECTGNICLAAKRQKREQITSDIIKGIKMRCRRCALQISKPVNGSLTVTTTAGN